MRQKVVGVEQVNLLYGRLRNEVEGVGTSASQADDGHDFLLELAGQRADPDTAGGSVGIIEHTSLLLVAAAEHTWADARLQYRGRPGHDGRVGRHLGIVVRVALVARLAGEAVPRCKPVTEVRACEMPCKGVPSALHGKSPSQCITCVSGLQVRSLPGRGSTPGCQAHLALGVDVGHLPHYQEAPLDPHEIAVRAELGQVGIKTEQCA